MGFEGATPTRPQGVGDSGTTVNYLIGPEDQWRLGVPATTSLEYRDLWPGIDLLYTGSASHLKYAFHVRPGADPAQIALAYEGASRLHVTDSGDLEVVTATTSFLDERPVAWQDVDGERRPVAVRHEVDGFTARLPVGGYYPGRELVIDPTVEIYAGYLPGEGDDAAYGVAVDGDGAVYLAGDTISTGFSVPLWTGVFDFSANGILDAFAAKVAPDGSAYAYVNFIGGSKDDAARAIAVDGDGSAYVTGSTYSTNFPVSPSGVYDSVPVGSNGYAKAWVFKLSPNGATRTWATFVKALNAAGRGIAVDGAGQPIVVGSATSLVATTAANSFKTSTSGGMEGFVVKLGANGAGAAYATYLGGSSADFAYAVDIDPSGRYAYVTGTTKSTNFHNTGATVYQALDDAFVTRLDLGVSGPPSLVYSRIIGGTGTEFGAGIAVDSWGNAYAVGETRSPTLVGWPTGSVMGPADGYIVQLDPAGLTLATQRVGGILADGLTAITVDGLDDVYVTGWTAGTVLVPPFPANQVTGTLLADANHGGSDAFVVKFPPGLGTATFGGYYGGPNDDMATDVTVDWGGFAYLVGATSSPGISTNGSQYESQRDAFFLKIGPGCTVILTSGNDTYVVNNNLNDVICGLDGDDNIITTGTGNDIVIAGPGNDFVQTGDGSDVVDGGPGDDVIGTGNGRDMVFGGSGNDQIYLGEDDDAASGGTGHDTIDGGSHRNYLRGGGSGDQLTNPSTPAGIIDGGGPVGVDTCTGSVIWFCP